MDLEPDTGYFVVLVARAFMRVAEARLRPLGLGPAHMPILVALSARGPLSQKDLARHARIEQPTAAALLQRMEAAGLITRSPDPRDRRATKVSQTQHAIALLPVALDQRAQTIGAATATLTAEEIHTLDALLARVLINLEALVDDSVSATGKTDRSCSESGRVTSSRH